MRSQMLPLLLARARSEGCDADVAALLDEFGLKVEDGAREITVPLLVHRTLCERIGVLLDDPSVGLNTAIRAPRGMYGLVEFTVRSSATLGDGLARLARYVRLLSDVIEVSIDTEGEHVVVTHGIPGEPEAGGRHANEFGLAMILRFGHETSGARMIPLEVHFAHAAPADDADVRAFFGAKTIKYGMGMNRLIHAKSVLDLPVVTSDGALVEFLDQQAEKSLPPRGPVPGLREQLARTLEGGAAPTLDLLAQALHMSARTLQRRLSDENTTFQAELDVVRQELAVGYLSDPRLSVYEVGVLLGYAEQRAFERAFRRWRGVTPKQFRQQTGISSRS